MLIQYYATRFYECQIQVSHHTPIETRGHLSHLGTNNQGSEGHNLGIRWRPKCPRSVSLHICHFVASIAIVMILTRDQGSVLGSTLDAKCQDIRGELQRDTFQCTK